MAAPPLLQLPTEILLSILKFSASCSSSEDPKPHITLVNLSQTCTTLHHAIFCSENDSVWHGPAVALGIPESLHLDQVLYPGTSAVQRRLWRNVVKLNLGWSRHFDPGTPIVPRLQKARRELPPQSKRGDWFGRRTIELVVGGEGNRRGARYETKHTSVKDDGCAVFQVMSQWSAIHTSPLSKWVAATLDPSLGKAREVAEWKSQGIWTATPLPVSAGFFVEERCKEYRVRAVDASTADLSHSWDLGKRMPDRFVAIGEILVAITFPESLELEPAPLMPTNLVCMESVGVKKSRWKKTVEAESRVLWEFDLNTEWAEEEPYYSFPHLKNFHVTRNYLVCLVTRHPSATLGKLTRTDFVVVSLKTGKVVKAMKFKTKSSSALSGTELRAPFTTASTHDFLLTDTYIVSGGAGGGLLVWNYSKDFDEPIYTIPDPMASEAVKLDGSPSSFPRLYSGLSMSADGRFVAAAMSDRLWLFDMVEKRVHGVYSNGRKVEKKDYFAMNPFDDFPAGVWCWWRDWRNIRDEKTGELVWEEVEGCDGIAYLTDLVDNKAPLKNGLAVRVGGFVGRELRDWAFLVVPMIGLALSSVGNWWTVGISVVAVLVSLLIRYRGSWRLD